MAVDQKLLLENLLRQHKRTDYLKPVLSKIDQLKKQTVNTTNEAIGTGLLEQVTQNNDKEFLVVMSNHTADLVRCWTTYTIGKNENLNIASDFYFKVISVYISPIVTPPFQCKVAAKWIAE